MGIFVELIDTYSLVTPFGVTFSKRGEKGGHFDSLAKSHG